VKTASAKAKGRALQQLVRDAILEEFAEHLEEDDVRSTAMGQSGEDIQLSPLARRLFPFTVECKAREAISVYPWFNQAKQNKDKGTPILVVKQNRSEPLVVLDLNDFMTLVSGVHK
jgi:hypothetical protein